VRHRPELADNHADGETSNMNGVGDMPLSMSQSLSGVHNTAEADENVSNIMSQSMQVPGSGDIGAGGDLMTSSTSSLNLQAKQRGRSAASSRNQTSQNWFMFDDADSSEGRADSAAKDKEREEKVRRMREYQEEERNRKIEELKQHAQSAKKFREQQEVERRKRIEETRAKDMDRRLQVEERRRDIERQEQERREAILAKNKERSHVMESNRKNSRSNIEFAFGSSAPRMLEPRIDSSSSSYWGSRSTLGPGFFDRRSAEREPSQETERKVKRTTSATGLDRSTEGDESGLVSGVSGPPQASAHRRRTDLVPTLVMPRDREGGMSRSNTPGLSRENSLAGSRPGSSLSAPRPNTSSGVRMRDKGQGARRQRPLSIATTGMTASMYEERQRPSHVPRQKSASTTPKPDRMKRARSVTSETVGLDDDNRSTSSSQNVGPTNRTPTRKTPSQVKAEAAARKAKSSNGRVSTPGSTPKSSLGARGTSGQGAPSKTPSPALSQDPLDPVEDHSKVRQSTPDIIKDNSKKASTTNISTAVENSASNNAEEIAREVEKEKSPSTEPADNVNNDTEVKEKKIITSEEEAKAKIAKKRQEMKEQKEREAEAERLRLEEEARLLEEQRLREEEEERKMIEETERLAEEARKQEEERIQKAIQEKEEADRKEKEEEERLKKEKEETERKVREDAEKREAELQEKLRKEEEERLARKKRIEEIMARTRGKGAAPKAAEPAANPPPPAQPQPQPEQSQPESQPQSLDSHVDPVKPDLLGDIAYSKVESVENAKNLLASKLSSDSSSDNSSTTESISPVNGKSSPSSNGDLSPELEKGALDSISIKSAEQDLSSPLITMENGEGPVKKQNGVIDSGAFDQILDLSAVPDSNKAEGASGAPSPIIAFEESITANNSTDLLS